MVETAEEVTLSSTGWCRSLPLGLLLCIPELNIKRQTGAHLTGTAHKNFESAMNEAITWQHPLFSQ